jgi:thermitase
MILALVAASLSLGLVAPVAVATPGLPAELSWFGDATDPDRARRAIVAHSHKMPDELAERMRYVDDNGRLRVMVALNHRDAGVEAFVEGNTTMLHWYGDGPRFYGLVTQDQFVALLEAEVVDFVEPDYQLAYFMARTSVDVNARSLEGAGTGVWSFDESAGTRGALVSDVPGLTADEATGAGVVVAITDSGIDRTHRDFGGFDCEPGPYQPCDSRIVKAMAVDHLVNTGLNPGSSAPTTELASGHGSHVAGTIGGNAFYTRDFQADPPRYGSDGHVFGVAPQSLLISVKNGDTIWAGLSTAALQWQLDHAEELGIRVSNNSWGCLGGCGFNGNSAIAQIFRGLYEAGVVTVFAVGNDGGGPNGASFSGFAQSPYVLGVASYNVDTSRLAASSSRGSDQAPLHDPETWTPESEPIHGTRRPDVAAPGVSVWSAAALTGGVASGLPRVSIGDAGAGRGPTVEYRLMSGTSMAAPHVAGAAALLFSACDDATPLHVMRAIKAGANDEKILKSSGPDFADPFEVGYGGLDVRASLDWLLDRPVGGGEGGPAPDPDPTPDPTPTPTPDPSPPPPTEETRYFFRSATGVGNADLLIGANEFSPGAEPTFTDPALWQDITGVGNGAPNALWDPNWRGEVDRPFQKFTIDFWQKAPVGELFGRASYDVTIWVGTGTDAARYDLPQLDADVETFRPGPFRLTHPFTTMHECPAANVRCSRGASETEEVPLNIEPGGEPVTVSISGRFIDSQASATIVYDSVTEPSGFVIGSVGPGDPDPTPSPDPSPTPDPDPSPTPDPGERGSYPLNPSDSFFGDQWGLTKINAPEAWQERNATGHGITIAVVDSGVDLNHEDFDCDDKLLVLEGAKIGTNQPPQDENGHGTHVAGIAGACTDNDIGVAGVAPDSTIMPVNVFDVPASILPGGFDQAMARGIRFATENGAHVINLSIGPIPGESYFPEFHPQTEAALEEAYEAGVVIAAAAGNFSLPLCQYPSLSRFVICVGATDRNDMKAWYSDFPNNVDRRSEEPGFEASVVAPGGQGTFCQEGIVSTYLSTQNGNCGYPAGYRDLDGTSMAAPHVAGVAALVYDRLGGERSKEAGQTVVETIISTTDDLGPPGYDPAFGHGRVNALNAVQAIEVPDDPEPAGTQLFFTENSADSGQYLDEVLIEARLIDSEGNPVAGKDVDFELTGENVEKSWTVTSDDEGLAGDEVTLDERPGAYVLRAAFAGDDDFEGSEASTFFVIEKRDTETDLDVEGRGVNRVLEATLTHLGDDTPVEGRTIEFYADGDHIGSAVTNEDGVATLRPPPRYRGGRFEFEAIFEGDDFYSGSSASQET